MRRRGRRRTQWRAGTAAAPREDMAEAGARQKRPCGTRRRGANSPAPPATNILLIRHYCLLVEDALLSGRVCALWRAFFAQHTREHNLVRRRRRQYSWHDFRAGNSLRPFPPLFNWVIDSRTDGRIREFCCFTSGWLGACCPKLRCPPTLDDCDDDGCWEKEGFFPLCGRRMIRKEGEEIRTFSFSLAAATGPHQAAPRRTPLNLLRARWDDCLLLTQFVPRVFFYSCIQITTRLCSIASYCYLFFLEQPLATRYFLHDFINIWG